MCDVSTSPISIRTYRAKDRDACRHLYSEALLGGKLAENDTGCDIDDIENVYLKSPGSHFWVAELPDGQVVGMIGVQHYDQDVGEIRRLRVATAHRRKGIGTILMETALKFCEEQQYLKITLDTYMDCEAALRLFEKFRFRHHRTRDVNGKRLMYFFLDLYARGQRAETD